MRVLILGCGRIGSKLAEMLDRDGHYVTVMDSNPEAFQRLSPTFRGEAVVGVGIDEDALRHAGIEQADAFVALTEGDNTNVMASQIAQQIFHVPQVISQIKDPIREDLYRLIGVETLCPTLMGADEILNKINVPLPPSDDRAGAKTSTEA
ncbi:MAG: TrkA family potassium uptake protein [Chloroflexi bacterium]|nr:TrkA family potassium uptake protein [Chloroflexota bacterium]